MSRTGAMRALAWTLQTRADVQVEAPTSRGGRNRGWYLTRCDGPCEAIMRKRVAAAARGVAGIEVESLRYVCNKTELAFIADREEMSVLAGSVRSTWRSSAVVHNRARG